MTFNRKNLIKSGNGSRFYQKASSGGGLMLKLFFILVVQIIGSITVAVLQFIIRKSRPVSFFKFRNSELYWYDEVWIESYKKIIKWEIII